MTGQQSLSQLSLLAGLDIPEEEQAALNADLQDMLSFAAAVCIAGEMEESGESSPVPLRADAAVPFEGDGLLPAADPEDGFCHFPK